VDVTPARDGRPVQGEPQVPLSSEELERIHADAAALGDRVDDEAVSGVCSNTLLDQIEWLTEALDDERQGRRLALGLLDFERRRLALLGDEALADQVVRLVEDNREWVRAIVRQARFVRPGAEAVLAAPSSSDAERQAAQRVLADLDDAEDALRGFDDGAPDAQV
jgi:hypothetical protein